METTKHTPELFISHSPDYFTNGAKVLRSGTKNGLVVAVFTRTGHEDELMELFQRAPEMAAEIERLKEELTIATNLANSMNKANGETIGRLRALLKRACNAMAPVEVLDRVRADIEKEGL